MTEQAMRDAFEASVTDNGKHPRFSNRYFADASTYSDPVIEFAWKYWQKACEWKGQDAPPAQSAPDGKIVAGSVEHQAMDAARDECSWAQATAYHRNSFLCGWEASTKYHILTRTAAQGRNP